MVAIVDYGVGNLFSLKSSLAAIGAEVTVTGDADVIRSADRIILPGVGAFGDAAAKLRESGLDKVVIDEAKKGKPLMGICLGMQLLLEGSEENLIERRETKGVVSGLGIIQGFARRFPDNGLKVPQIGWNNLTDVTGRLLTEGDYVYFVHSYCCQLGDARDCAAKTEYGVSYCASFERDNIFGMQFHPEKSGEAGLKILSKFVAETKR